MSKEGPNMQKYMSGDSNVSDRYRSRRDTYRRSKSRGREVPRKSDLNQAGLNRILFRQTSKKLDDLPEEDVKMEVVVRIRPYHKPELKKVSTGEVIDCLEVEANSVLIQNPLLLTNSSSNYPKKPFEVTAVYKEEVTNKMMFDGTIKCNLDRLLSGYNMSILCYGVTGAGKTHTMFGDLKWNSSNEEGEKGLVFEAAAYLLNSCKGLPSTKSVAIDASIYEIYNENIRDLTSECGENLLIGEDLNKDVYIKELSKVRIENIEQLRKIIVAGNCRRVKAATNKNVHSSRSHAIVEINVVCKSENSDKMIVKTGKLMMIDLAGSERLDAHETDSKGKEMNVIRKQEGAKINKSLLSLTNCILQLAEGNQKFTNYRDSKLTRILKNSLGGNSRTLLIGCISKGSDEYENTFNTLSYCSKAANIKKKVKANIANLDIERSLISIETPQANPSMNPIVFKERLFEDKRSRSREQTSFFEEERIILGYKRPFKHADYVSIMKEMISKKQTLEERYRKKQVNHTEYFNNVQVYNDLSLKILGLMEKNHEYHNPRGASTKRASAMQEMKPTDRFLSTARHTVRSEYPGQDIETARRGGNRLMVPNYNSQVVKVPSRDQSPNLRYTTNTIGRHQINHLKICERSEGGRLDSRGSNYSRSPEPSYKDSATDVIKLKTARENYRQFKGKLREVYEMMVVQGGSEDADLTQSIANIIRTQKDNKYILSSSQEKSMGALIVYMRGKTKNEGVQAPLLKNYNLLT